MRFFCALIAIAVAGLPGTACVVECNCPGLPDGSCALAGDAGAPDEDAGAADEDAGAPFEDASPPDRNPPLISLTGSPRIYLARGEPFVEPGYQAFDDVDGNITANVVVSGTVDTSLAQTYTVTYSVSDSAGNHSNALRTVVVRHTKNTIAGTYVVTESCTISGNFGPYSASITPRSGTDFTITMNNFGDFPTTVDLQAELSGENGQLVDIPSQVVIGITFLGSGTVAEDGGSLVVTYNADDGVSDDDCTATWVRQ